MDANREKAIGLIAQIPIVTAYFHRTRQKKELLPPIQRSERPRIFFT